MASDIGVPDYEDMGYDVLSLEDLDLDLSGAEGIPSGEDEPEEVTAEPKKPKRGKFPERPITNGRPTIDITASNQAENMRQILVAIRMGILTDTYQRSGQLVRLRQIDGRAMIEEMGPEALRNELATKAHIHYMKQTDDGPESHEVLPDTALCKAILAAAEWAPLDVLRDVAGQPVIRPDGTLLQEQGYDEATGYYLDPLRTMKPVPERPTPSQVAAARSFLLDELLVDFPWVGEADRANYIALLATPLLRPYIGGLSPFGVISATAPGSGKTLLGEDIPKRLYRSVSYAWPSGEAEMRKAITSSFNDQANVVVWDNVPLGHEINSASLAKLLTSDMWSDRILKRSANLHATNDRLWLVTGNGLKVGGDIRTRTVLVQLDPQMERPELRTGFKLGNLSSWIEKPAHQNKLLRALLILALDWIAAGGKRGRFVMRNFTPWAEGMGGFLLHHGIVGFLANEDRLRSADSEEERWSGFLADLLEKSGGRYLKAAEIHGLYVDIMDRDDTGLLPLTKKGQVPNSQGLGMILSSSVGRCYGGMKLVKKVESNQGCFAVVAVSGN